LWETNFFARFIYPAEVEAPDAQRDAPSFLAEQQQHAVIASL